MNKAFRVDELYKKIEKKTQAIRRKTATGATIFTEAGARLLGLFPSTNLPNTLWVADDIDKKIDSGDWLTGGERLWIAPQRDYFFTNPQDFDGFHVSAHLDPGIYLQKNDLTFSNSFSLTNHNSKIEHSECLARRKFSIIDDDPYESGLDYAGVEIGDHLSISGFNIDMCAWSIAMVYTCGPQNPGTVLLPIANNDAIVNYFEPIPHNRSSIEHGYARFLIDSKKALKMAIRPEGIVWDNPAKVVYISPFPGIEKWFCLVKRSNDLPEDQDSCVDTASFNPVGPKGAVQAYNHGYDSEMLYGEIELQFNKGSSDANKTTSGGVHELLSYAGSKNEILHLAKTILRTDSVPLIYE